MGKALRARRTEIVAKLTDNERCLICGAAKPTDAKWISAIRSSRSRREVG